MSKELRQIPEVTVSIPKSWVKLKALIDSVPDCRVTIDFVNACPHKLRSIIPDIRFDGNRELPSFLMSLDSKKGLILTDDDDK